MNLEHYHQIVAHAFYCGEHEAGRRAAEAMLRHPMSPEREATVRRNRTWYTQPLGEIIKADFYRIEGAPCRPGWTLFNPSIVWDDGRFVVNVRSSNYHIVDGRYVIPPEDGDTIRTDNFLAFLDDNLQTKEVHPLAATYERSEYPVDGLEDVRLNVVDGAGLVSATVRNWAGLDGTCRIGVGHVARAATGFTVRDLTVRTTADGQHEKNWMPILGTERFLYHCHLSGMVATVEADGDEWRVTTGGASPHVARGFRGGSQLVPIGGGHWLAIVHEVAHDGNIRIYEHRFVQFDEHDDWRIVAVSRPFAFREPRTIEFCAGLAIRGMRLVASFGVKDEDAWLADVALPDVLGIMEAV